MKNKIAESLDEMKGTVLPESTEVFYVDGEYIKIGDRDVIEVENPTTQKTLTRVPSCTKEDVNRAYQTARDSQKQWASTPISERIQIIRKAAGFLQEHREDLALLNALEAGGVSPKGSFEAQMAITFLETSCELAMRSTGETKPSMIPGKENLVVQEPSGVIGVITPWNFPLLLAMRSVAPALVLGNSVVLKPDEHTPLLGGLVLAQMFDEAGLPGGVFNVVSGYGDTIGDTITDHDIPSVISFTGSSEVGRRVGQKAVSNMSYPALELGGNGAHIVTQDADLERAVDAGVFGTFTHQGQGCITINRHLIHESLYDGYVERLSKRAEELIEKMGDPRDEGVLQGPLINESQRDKVIGLINDSVDAGASLEVGGDSKGLFVEPTVLSEVTNKMPVASNEHFGPVAPIIRFTSEDEAIALANDTEYGLSGSIHSADLERARDLAGRMETGMVHINDQPLNDEPGMPFGGVKASGIGRFNDRWVMEEFTSTKWISIQREPRKYPF